MKTILKDRFKDKVMIVTGASQGIGKETAIRAAEEGAKVVLIDLSLEGEKVSEEINKNGGTSIFIKSDLTNEDEVKFLVKKTIDRFGKIDILINNAGVTCSPAALHLVKNENFDFVFKTNLYSVFLCCKHVISQFIKQNTGGSIVNTASIGGIVGLRSTSAYVSSKHAINGLTKNMAIDYAKYGIRVNSVNPAPTDTPMQRESMKTVKEQITKAIESGLISKDRASSMMGDKSNNLQHRVSDASEQAASILFLASDDASYITGSILQTDGGWTAF